MGQKLDPVSEVFTLFLGQQRSLVAVFETPSYIVDVAKCTLHLCVVHVRHYRWKHTFFQMPWNSLLPHLSGIQLVLRKVPCNNLRVMLTEDEIQGGICT